jgi:dTDP-4-amino-4,6-dideoxygalactose transaminase
MVALNALDLSGEVITTPFTFAATAHAIKWSNLTPVFVDIDPQTFNLDPAAVAGAITEKTSCILPVHCYGNPCDTAGLAAVANDNNLKLLYDGSHAFGVDCDCGSLLNHGDATTLSFHATKVFNTFEGGAIVCADHVLKEKVDRLRNFGFEDETSFSAVGVNAKMNEFSAALGLLQIGHVNRAIELRMNIADRYRENLAGIPGIQLPPRPCSSKPNGAYFPILITEESCIDRDCVYEYLKERKINARRYFYPLVSDIYGYGDKSHRQPAKQNAAKASESVICLPIYPDLRAAEVDYVCETLISACQP